jgi:hypothetical protein
MTLPEGAGRTPAPALLDFAVVGAASVHFF